MKQFYVCAVALCLTATLGACSKDTVQPTSPAPLTAKETLLTAKKWQLAAVNNATTFSDNTIPLIPYSYKQDALVEACQQDDFTQFNADKTGIRDEGATRCTTSDPQTRPLTWTFNANETELTVASTRNGQVVTEKGEVVALTPTRLELRTTTTTTQYGYQVLSTVTTTYIAH